MDMIEQIEMQDAVKAWEKIEWRVRHIALTIARTRDTFINGKSKTVTDWHIEKIYLGSRGEDGPVVTVVLYTDFGNRPWSVKFGDPLEDANRYYDDAPRYLYERVAFPEEWLYQDEAIWLPIVEEQGRKIAKHRREYEKKGLEDALNRNRSENIRLNKLLDEIVAAEIREVT